MRIARPDGTVIRTLPLTWGSSSYTAAWDGKVYLHALPSKPNARGVANFRAPGTPLLGFGNGSLLLTEENRPEEGISVWHAIDSGHLGALPNCRSCTRRVGCATPVSSEVSFSIRLGRSALCRWLLSGPRSEPVRKSERRRPGPCGRPLFRVRFGHRRQST